MSSKAGEVSKVLQSLLEEIFINLFFRWFHNLMVPGSLD